MKKKLYSPSKMMHEAFPTLFWTTWSSILLQLLDAVVYFITVVLVE